MGRNGWTLAGDGDDGGGDVTDGADTGGIEAEEAVVEAARAAVAGVSKDEGGWDCNRSERHPCL